MKLNEIMLKGLVNGIYFICSDKIIRLPTPIMFWSKANNDFCLSYELRTGKKLYFFMKNYNKYWSLERSVLERRENE